MHYMGGKKKIAVPIASFLEGLRHVRPFVEPFCGGLFITAAMRGERRASDNEPSLITLYREIQQGWLPPEHLSPEEYEALRQKNDPADPLTAFAAYGCSFGGKRWGGYAMRNSEHWGLERTLFGWEARKMVNHLDVQRWVARRPRSREAASVDDPRLQEAMKVGSRTKRSFAAMAKRGLLLRMRRCQSATFRCSDYRDTAPVGALVYADPPYKGTTDYGAAFDHAAFWDWCRSVATSNTLVVSEEQAPEDFVCVWQAQVERKLAGGGVQGNRTERLFMHRSQALQRGAA